MGKQGEVRNFYGIATEFLLACKVRIFVICPQKVDNDFGGYFNIPMLFSATSPFRHTQEYRHCPLRFCMFLFPYISASNTFLLPQAKCLYVLEHTFPQFFLLQNP